MNLKKEMKRSAVALCTATMLMSTPAGYMLPQVVPIVAEAATTTTKTTTKTTSSTKTSGNKRTTTKKTVKTTVKTTKQTQSKKATKTYTTAAKTTKNTTKKSGSTTTNTKVTLKYKYTKGSKARQKIETTVVTTTVVSTTTIKTVGKRGPTKSSQKKQYVSISSIAPKAHTNVIKAFKTMKFKVLVDPSVTFSGKCDVANQLITVDVNTDKAIYHELGHFAAFVAGNVDMKDEFASIFKAEKSKFTATRGNTSYILTSASEYFADSYQDYVENPSKLKKERPKTYKYIKQSIEKITDERIQLINSVYYA